MGRIYISYKSFSLRPFTDHSFLNWTLVVYLSSLHGPVIVRMAWTLFQDGSNIIPARDDLDYIIPAQGSVGNASFPLWFTCLCLTHLTLVSRPRTLLLATLITFCSSLYLFLRRLSIRQHQYWHWASPTPSPDVDIEVPGQCTCTRLNQLLCNML